MKKIKIDECREILSSGNVWSWFFILCGGLFYMNWILLTNPTSKNPLIRLIYRWNKKGYCGFHYENRLKMCYVYGGIHLVETIIMASMGGVFSLTNILLNIYPIIVQLWIGWRCWRIKNLRRTCGLIKEQ